MSHAQTFIDFGTIATARARVNDPSTSHEAAEAINPCLSQEKVLTWMEAAFRPITSEEVVDALEALYSPSRIRGALKELCQQGRVKVLDTDGKTKRGGRCSRYAITG